MGRIKIEEVDKDVYKLSDGSENTLYLSGEQLRNLRGDIKSYFEENSTCDSSGGDYDYDDPNDFADW